MKPILHEIMLHNREELCCDPRCWDNFWGVAYTQIEYEVREFIRGNVRNKVWNKVR